jgi:predicted GH43/DUF377 family glycosyl hydrolase
LSQSTFLNRQALFLRPDPSRVVVRSFKPSTEPRDVNPNNKTRAVHLIDRILGLDLENAETLLAEVLENFEGRHRNLLAKFESRAREISQALAPHDQFSKTQFQLLGAYFLCEYSFEASALFNPSIVSHPDQSGVEVGSLRFILSLRAVGEGHVSSLTFRTGVVAVDGSIVIDPTVRLASTPTVIASRPTPAGDQLDLLFSDEESIGERVILPITPFQTHGIEDARFVKFEDEGDCTYYATYTAYCGTAIRSELLETRDFVSFRMSPLVGTAASNKGMGLFPRKIDGLYSMIVRQDNENLFLLKSDDLYTWNGGELILSPKFSWEFVQMGSCGSPIELDEGWLLLTHGVGPLRKYAIGCALLDKRDPSKVLARSSVPLVRPEAAEREGYVPNVVYTCGALRHNNLIILPYAVCDSYSNFATIKVSDLLKTLDG